MWPVPLMKSEVAMRMTVLHANHSVNDKHYMLLHAIPAWLAQSYVTFTMKVQNIIIDACLSLLWREGVFVSRGQWSGGTLVGHFSMRGGNNIIVIWIDVHDSVKAGCSIFKPKVGRAKASPPWLPWNNPSSLLYVWMFSLLLQQNSGHVDS